MHIFVPSEPRQWFPDPYVCVYAGSLEKTATKGPIFLVMLKPWLPHPLMC